MRQQSAVFQIRNRKESEVAIALFRNSAPGRKGVSGPPGPPRRQGRQRHDPPPPRSPEPRHTAPAAVAGCPPSPLARCSRAGERGPTPRRSLPALHREVDARAEVTGPPRVGLTRGTRFPAANLRPGGPPGSPRRFPRSQPSPSRALLPAPTPLSLRIGPQRRRAPHPTEEAQPAANGRRSKGRGERRWRAAGQRPPKAHPGRGRASPPRRRLPLAGPGRASLSAAPCNRRDAAGAARALAPRGLSPSLPACRPSVLPRARWRGQPSGTGLLGRRLRSLRPRGRPPLPAALPGWKFPLTLRRRKRPGGAGGRWGAERERAAVGRERWGGGGGAPVQLRAPPAGSGRPAALEKPTPGG